jgi:arsenate reductase
MSVTIYHNPRCSKSRATLALLEDNNAGATVVEYLTNPPSVDELKNILVLLCMTPHELVRPKAAKTAGLNDPALGDDALIAAIIAKDIIWRANAVLLRFTHEQNEHSLKKQP